MKESSQIYYDDWPLYFYLLFILWFHCKNKYSCIIIVQKQISFPVLSNCKLNILSKLRENKYSYEYREMLCRYIFPGLALGAALGQTGVITNAMINRAAEVSTRKMVWVR
jgi:hypothetical protein